MSAMLKQVPRSTFHKHTDRKNKFKEAPYMYMSPNSSTCQHIHLEEINFEEANHMNMSALLKLYDMSATYP